MFPIIQFIVTFRYQSSKMDKVSYTFDYVCVKRNKTKQKANLFVRYFVHCRYDANERCTADRSRSRSLHIILYSINSFFCFFL